MHRRSQLLEHSVELWTRNSSFFTVFVWNFFVNKCPMLVWNVPSCNKSMDSYSSRSIRSVVFCNLTIKYYQLFDLKADLSDPENYLRIQGKVQISNAPMKKIGHFHKQCLSERMRLFKELCDLWSIISIICTQLLCTICLDIQF